MLSSTYSVGQPIICKTTGQWISPLSRLTAPEQNRLSRRLARTHAAADAVGAGSSPRRTVAADTIEAGPSRHFFWAPLSRVAR
jgi:hypothetical protein